VSPPKKKRCQYEDQFHFVVTKIVCGQRTSEQSRSVAESLRMSGRRDDKDSTSRQAAGHVNNGQMMGQMPSRG
jgi:hypothetical protein